MDKLNDKVKVGRSQTYQDAQVVGLTGLDQGFNVMRAIDSTSSGELKVAVSSHLVDSPDMKARTNIADAATSTFLKCDADGKLEIEATLELDSSTLAKAVTQTDGTQKAKCMGIDGSGGQQQILVESNGSLILGSGTVKTGNTVGDGSGTAKFLKTNADGELSVNLGSSTTQSVNLVANESSDGTGTSRFVVCNTNGFLKVKDDELETNLVQGLFSTQMMGRTTIGDTNTRKNLICDADGHLQVDVLSGAGGGTQFAGGAALVATGTGTAMIGRDSTNVARLVATDANGHIEIVSSTGAGVALESAQTTGNSSLSSIDGKITACNTGAVVVSSSTLPSGASTEATLSAMSAKLPTPTTTAVVLTSTSTAISAGATQDFKTGTTGFTQFNVAGVRELSYIIEGSGTSPSLTATELVGAETGVLVPVAGLGGGSSTANFAFASSISAQHRGIQIKNNSVGDSYTVTKITAVYTT